MTEERKFAILFAATLMCARKLMEIEEKPSPCRNWSNEFRIFARDENGKIINEHKFHLMASTRYLFLGPMTR